MQVFKKFLNNIDVNDILMLIGLIGIGSGLWLYDPKMSLTATGSLLFAVGFFTR